MKMLIIGGAGYIGGVTAHLATQAGHEVTVLDNFSTGRQHNVPHDAKLITADITDRSAIQKVFTDNHYDVVMHFAARIQVTESMQKPYDYFYTNTFGTLNVMDAAAKTGVKNYIFSSTAATYGEPVHIPLTETDPTSPVNPYGWSKLLTEQLLKSYEITNQLNWIALRYFNVVGAYNGVGTDYPFVSHIVPMFLAGMRQHTPALIFGDDYDTPDGTCVRDYVHVIDIAEAHLLAAGALTNGKTLNQPINLASKHGYSVREVIDTFNDVTKANMPVQVRPRRPGDPARLIASNERAKQLLGWQPQRDLRTAIKDHFEWYKQQKNPNAPIQ